MNLRYFLSLFFTLLSIFQVNAQYSITYPQNPDIPYYYAYNGDGTDFALGEGIDGDYYYTNRATGFGSYHEDSYFVGAYNGDFHVTAGQKFERVAVIQLIGQTLQIDRIDFDGTIEDATNYDFSPTSSVTLFDVFSSQYYGDRSIYVSGIETNFVNEKVVFTIKFDEFLQEVWREDYIIDASVEAIEVIDDIRNQGENGLLIAYVRPSDFSIQAFYRNFDDGSIIWENEVMNSAAQATVPVLNHSYLYVQDAYIYGNYESTNGDTTFYFSYQFEEITNVPIFEKTTKYVAGSTQYELSHQIQAFNIFPNDPSTYVEIGTSFQHNPNGQVYLTKKNLDGRVHWYKEYDFLADVRYVHSYGYIAGMVDGEGWFAYFDRNGNLAKREGICQNSNNLMDNACITMSSQMLDGGAENAMDGMTSDNATTDFAATTTEEYRPWMIIDLGKIYLIDSIIIHPSDDPDKEFTNTFIYGDLHPIPAEANRAHTTIEWIERFYTPAMTEPFTVSGYNGTVDLNFPARYISLHKYGFGILEIEEIEIFGCAPAMCEDNDGDGFCFTEDCNDFDAVVPALPGTPCDDGNPLTENDVIQNDHCTCSGGLPNVDADDDGLPASEDCNDGLNNSTYCNHFVRYSGGFHQGQLDPNNCECVAGLADFGCNLNYKVTGSTLTVYGIQDDGQTGLNLFDANFQIIFNCDADNCNENFIEITDLPDGQYYLNAQIWTSPDCNLEATIIIDQNACEDFDGDGICAINDPNPTNGNIPATPGTPCNDCNPDTENDTIQADGVTCAGTQIACDDADDDGICTDDDCDDQNPNIPTTPGTACDDDNVDTENDVIQADGCTCLGEMPCVDSDNDGICVDDDCDDSNPDLPTTPGTPCDDGQLHTSGDIILADGCTCAGLEIFGTNNDSPVSSINGNFSTNNQLTTAKSKWSKQNHSSFIKLLPNPVNSQLTILINSPSSIKEEITIYNSHGQIQMQSFQKMVIGINTIKMDVTTFPNGVYFLKMKSSEVVKRLVKL